MTDNELELYFEYFERLNRGIRQLGKIICFQCSDVDVLMNRIRKRGRAEERAMTRPFLRDSMATIRHFQSVRSQAQNRCDDLGCDPLQYPRGKSGPNVPQHLRGLSSHLSPAPELP